MSGPAPEPPEGGDRHVVLFSGHHVASARRAGFHHLAFAYRRMGWRVTFVTVGMSLLSLIRPDHRRRSFRLRDRNRAIPIEPGLESYVWFTTWHPSDTRSPTANRLTTPIFRRFADMPFRDLPRLVSGASLVIVESGFGLFLVPRLRRMLPDARLVYRQSDDLDALVAHPVLHEAEEAALPAFDLVSVPDEARRDRFAGRDRVIVQAHGVDTALLSAASVDPYAHGRFAVNAVFVGVAGLDEAAIAAAAEGLSDWGFHLVGPWTTGPRPSNVVIHGELPFAQTAPLIAHAGIGLHTLRMRHAASMRMTNKVLQYTYCRLPIVAERAAAPPWPHVFTYSGDDPETVIDACRTAARFPRDRVPADEVQSWEQLAQALATSEPAFTRPDGPPTPPPRSPRPATPGTAGD